MPRLDLFGTRGVDAVSLDEIAREVGVRKQTLLYWFPTKDELVHAVLSRRRRAGRGDRCRRALDLGRPARPHRRRRPGRVPSRRSTTGAAGTRPRGQPSPRRTADRLRARIQPLIDRCIEYLALEMDKGRLRRGDPRLIASLAYATVTGIATEPEALRAVGWAPNAIGLRHLRDELRAFLRAALTP